MLFLPRAPTVLANIHTIETGVDNRRRTDYTHQENANAIHILAHAVSLEERRELPDLHAPVDWIYSQLWFKQIAQWNGIALVVPKRVYEELGAVPLTRCRSPI